MSRLSDAERLQMDKDFVKPNERKKDRRVSINSVIDPQLERRSGRDRRRDKPQPSIQHKKLWWFK